MAVNYLVISAFSTALSFIALRLRTEFSLDKLQTDGLITGNFIHTENVNHVLELLLGSYSMALVILTLKIDTLIPRPGYKQKLWKCEAYMSLSDNCRFILEFIYLRVIIYCDSKFMLSYFNLVSLFGGSFLHVQTVFFGQLYPSEIRKLIERIINYVIYKKPHGPHGYITGNQHTIPKISFSSSVSVVYDNRIGLSFVLYKTLNPSMFLLLFFEPLSITFETMQVCLIYACAVFMINAIILEAILVHGFQLLEISFHAVGNTVDCQRSKLFDLSVAGSFWEWKGILIRNLGFFLDLATLIMAVGHYVLIWWLHGMAFHLADAVLFLNIRALLTAIVKRIKGFIKLRMALGALHAALPDATSEEIQAYDDECAICRESMAKAKKLHCDHLFHLSCLRSWLDQGLNEAYSCPTCRKPLFLGRTENEVNYRQINSGLDRQNMPGHTLATGVFPNQMQNPVEGSPWRSAGLDSGRPHSWPTQSVDGAGPSTGVGSVGLGRVHMMMRHLASVGDTAVEHTAWSPWSMNPSQAAASVSSVPPNVGGRYPGNAGSLRMRTTPSTGKGNIANILTMTETV
ncbi:hypothetical protein Goarm_018028 [Gossypium armourianum]|uniref:RING-type domain-containing protein n=1 Tax=Gossypium armourianum TaxID=34283 RepID=A0A7J9IHT1_9ROSI|nr:hypothetical protein [Gossypium armourianum]